MRDLGAASKLIATTQTAVAKSQSFAVDLADELYGGAPRSTQRQPYPSSKRQFGPRAKISGCASRTPSAWRC